MPEHPGRLTDIRATCHWPGCNRAPDVSVDYEQTKRCELRLAWLAPYGGVNLWDRHAVELALRDGAGAWVLSLVRLEERSPHRVPRAPLHAPLWPLAGARV
jgi:hypothetical protein